jgi:hypothetical protein
VDEPFYRARSDSHAEDSSDIGEPVIRSWGDEAKPSRADIDGGPEGPPYIEDPPVEDEPAPEWMRAAIERVARSRHDRPTAPAPPRPEPRGPVFELHDDDDDHEPEPEREPETTTLSDIARELGLTINPPAGGKEPSWTALNKTAFNAEEEAVWDAEVKRALATSAQAAAAPPPPPQPIVAPAHVAPPPPPPPDPIAPLQPASPPPASVRPAAPQSFIPPSPAPSSFIPPPQAVRPPERVRTEASPPRPIVERASEPEPRGRFLKIAATILLAAGALGAMGYGGSRYFSSITAPGSLVVQSTPPGAEVAIDGEARGTTPLALDLPPGRHEVAMTRRGLTRRFIVEIRPGEETTQALDWSSVRAMGALSVNSNPVGAKVSVDGRSYGVTPITIPDLPAGRRRVVLESSAGTVRRDVTIEPDGTATLDEAIFSGWIAVFAPIELQIFEGSRLIGTTDNSRILVPPGHHSLTLVNKELGVRLPRAVDVAPGQVVPINITDVPTAAPAAPDETVPSPRAPPQ